MNSLTSRFNTGRWNHTRIARRPPAVTHAYAHSAKSPVHKTDRRVILIAIITRIKITHPTPCPCRRTAKGVAPRCEYPAPIGWLRRRVGIRRAIAPVIRVINETRRRHTNCQYVCLPESTPDRALGAFPRSTCLHRRGLRRPAVSCFGARRDRSRDRRVPG